MDQNANGVEAGRGVVSSLSHGPVPQVNGEGARRLTPF
jgi:hypothetical protein